MLNSRQPDKVVHLTFLRSSVMSLLFHLGVKLPGELASVVVGVRDDRFVCSPSIFSYFAIFGVKHAPTHVVTVHS